MTSDPSSPSLLDQLIESFVQRQRRGERPSIDEYARLYPELAAEIREVFPALAVMEELASDPAATTGPEADAGPGPFLAPRRLGEYRILREVGRGGMGVVYEAVQESLGRHVALKVLPPHAAAEPLLVERFRREAQAAARLHHSNIVPVFGVGEEQGVTFYAMQFIRGQTLDSVLHEVRRFRRQDGPTVVNPADPPGPVARSLLTGHFEVAPPGDGRPEAETGHARAADTRPALPSSSGDARYFRKVAEIGAQVADALAYAHGQGVVHRDVKPSNLMLDPGGGVWVTDFGLAKAEGAAELTRPGDVLGTLRYMSPEQLAGEADARSDVYSLGITLYELATLHPAFDDGARGELVERIRKADPVPPRKRDPAVPRDLETIILKASAKEPGRRYQSAAELADDLRRFLADRPILARRAGWREQAWRWCRRNPAVAAALALFVLALLSGTAVSTVFYFLADRRADAESKAKDRERDAKEELGKALRLAQENLLLSRTSDYANRLTLALRGLEANDPAYAAELLDACPPDLAGWEHRCLRRAVERRMRTFKITEGDVWANAFLWCPDGRVASGTNDGRVVLSDPDAGRPVLTLEGLTGRVGQLTWCDGRLAAHDGSRLCVWDPEGKLVRSWEAPADYEFLSAAFWPGSGRVAAVVSSLKLKQSGVRLYDPATGRDADFLGRGVLGGLAFRPDGKRMALLALLAGRGEVEVWETTGPEEPLRLLAREKVPYDVGNPGQRLAATYRRPFFPAYSPDGKRLVVGGAVLDADTARVAVTLKGPAGSYLRPVRFSPDGKRLVASGGGRDFQPTVWSAETGEVVLALAGQTTARQPCFSPDGRRLAGNRDGRVCVWDLDALAAPLPPTSWPSSPGPWTVPTASCR